MAFSGAVKLADLDDFLGPSQECIKPKLDAAAAGPPAAEEAPAGGRRAPVMLSLEDDGAAPAAAGVPGAEFGQIRTVGGAGQEAKAAITLDDCLACSGCVTSAETVLITQQSSAEFLGVLRRGAAGAAGDAPARPRLVVVTVSPQARAALAHRHGLGLAAAQRRLVAFFRALGADAVLDGGAAMDVAVLEARAELLERVREGAAAGAAPRALLAGECPGWVCYAEKTQGRRVLDHISRVKSPQQIMGALVKRHLAGRLAPGAGPADVYHASVMPCYDKKLEGSRRDFFIEEHDTREVDCVLTTGEVEAMLAAELGGAPLGERPEAPLDRSLLPAGAPEDAAERELLAIPHDAGASGGYADSLFRHAARELAGLELPAGEPLAYKQGRNSDFTELELALPGGAPPLRFARAYGFRNIQNVVRKLKRGRCAYAYVEVMACPSGCLNGGGQPATDARGKGLAEQRAALDSLDAAYHEAKPRDPADSEVARRLYAEWIGGEPGSAAAARLLHTQFHEIPKADANPLAIRW